jgi:hypothetical protein
MKTSTITVLFLTAMIGTSGIALAASTHHASSHMSARYAAACHTLSGQWSSAIATHQHGRHLSQAKRQERLGQRDCRSNRTAELKAGVMHYRTALRSIGVRPSA